MGRSLYLTALLWRNYGGGEVQPGGRKIFVLMTDDRREGLRSVSPACCICLISVRATCSLRRPGVGLNWRNPLTREAHVFSLQIKPRRSEGLNSLGFILIRRVKGLAYDPPRSALAGSRPGALWRPGCCPA